jgi:hypothetical protein
MFRCPNSVLSVGTTMIGSFRAFVSAHGLEQRSVAEKLTPTELATYGRAEMRTADRSKIRDATYREPKRRIKACINCKWFFEDYEESFCTVGTTEDSGYPELYLDGKYLNNLLAVCDVWEPAITPS